MLSKPPTPWRASLRRLRMAIESGDEPPFGPGRSTGVEPVKLMPDGSVKLTAKV